MKPEWMEDLTWDEVLILIVMALAVGYTLVRIIQWVWK